MADQVQPQGTVKPVQATAQVQPKPIPDKGEKALKEVEKLKLSKAEEETRKSLVSKIALIIASFMLSGVGFFTWQMLKKSTKDVGSEMDLMAGPAGGLLSSLSKGALIVGIAGVVVGVFLTVYTLGDYFSRKGKAIKLEKKVEGKTEPKPVEPKPEQQPVAAKQPVAQKTEPPKLVS